GRAICPVCGRELRPDSPGSAADAVLAAPHGARFVIAFPLPRSAAATSDVLLDTLRSRGFVRVMVDGNTLHLDDVVTSKTDLAAAGEVLVIVDRLTVGADIRGRTVDGLATAFKNGEGDAAVVFPDLRPPLTTLHRFTDRLECPDDH